MESWKQGLLAAFVVMVAVGLGGGLQAWSLDHGAAVTGGPSNVVTVPAMPCPVAKDICAVAATVEKNLRAPDYSKVTSVDSLQVGLRAAMHVILADGKPRLVSIGCPYDGRSPSCEESFALVFTTLQPQDDWTGITGIVVLRYDRFSQGALVTATLAEVNGLAQRDARRVALAGGVANAPCNLTGIAPDMGTNTCSSSEFEPFGTQGPFIPAEVSRQQPFTVLAPAATPLDSLLYVVTGCWACEGYDTGLERVITDPDGNVSVEHVADPPLLPNEIVTEYRATPDGAMLVVATCSATPRCYPIGSPSFDAHSRLFASKDGGFTWEELASYQGYMAPWQMGADGRILVLRTFGSGDPSTWSTTVQLLPGGAQVVRPPGLAESYALPRLVPGGVAWLSNNQVLPGTDGVPAINVPLGPGDQLTDLLPLADGRILFTWFDNASNPGAGTHHLVGLLSAKGELLWTRQMPSDGEFALNGQFAGALLIGNVAAPRSMGIGQLPALIDLDSAAVQPFDLALGQQPLVGRNRFIAAISGPFVRISRLGTCADVRQSPSNAAKSLGCFKDGVFLQDLGDVTTADGTAWVHVITPANEEGWADARFLAQ